MIQMAKHQITRDDYHALKTMKFGERIKFLRTKLQEREFETYRPTNIAAFGCTLINTFSTGQYSNIEAGRSDNPAIKYLQAICTAFNVSIQVLFDEYYAGNAMPNKLFYFGYGANERNPMKPFQADLVVFIKHPNDGLTNDEWSYLNDISFLSGMNEPVSHYIHNGMGLYGKGDRKKILEVGLHPKERQELFQSMKNHLNQLMVVTMEDYTFITPDGLYLLIKQPLAHSAGQTTSTTTHATHTNVVTAESAR
jgi:transcriptional regulator with XRE-family HTH domain